MDSELIKQLLQGEIFWYETTTSSATTAAATAPSAFVPFSTAVLGCVDGDGNSGNLNKRMIGFLKKSWPSAGAADAKEGGKERCFLHMMNERMRREKQKRSYYALHSMLPHGTKNDKNSIVQMAMKSVQELEWVKKDLERRNLELQANYNEGKRIKVKIEDPTSGIDSMLEALKCLKAMDSKPTMIHSMFTHQQFLAVMEFESQMGAAKVEAAVTKTLQEAERKLQRRWTDPILIHDHKF
ncbi:40S ribosomal protein S15-like isoform 1 [Hibiscus syriacus]|uniref:40S ribosomal protein S15-like isoform 1 n=1 Tax=Hibiscus syriacus TaxID=106335 RepID=A0A6A3A4U7_HIBSY|nr:transcription factor bHLH92-like [Hibiscus syriacus]KAE8698265.1 40S ribosomal protein S15-like isoform 1 [Hibiscus syriacus]